MLLLAHQLKELFESTEATLKETEGALEETKVCVHMCACVRACVRAFSCVCVLVLLIAYVLARLP